MLQHLPESGSGICPELGPQERQADDGTGLSAKALAFMAAGDHFRSFLAELPNLYVALAQLLDQIPPGRVSTYGWLAEALGDMAAARWIGQYLALPHELAGPQVNGQSQQCPCHRVVRSDGSVGLYAHGNPEAKAKLLRREGVRFAGGVVELERHGFRDFSTERPLAKLKQLQDQLARAVEISPLAASPETVGALDVAYQDDLACGVYVVMDSSGRRILRETTLRCQVKFPYISGFLAFRELPVLIQLVEWASKEGCLGQVLLVDGSGILHPRGVGIASHLGIIAGLPTIGITKTLLCGSLEPAQDTVFPQWWIVHKGARVGYAFRPRPHSKDLVYVCPGHRTDVRSCLEVVKPLCRGRRLPEPLYWADRRSKEARHH
ncbi:MAG: endonuclease V [Thermoguttaceae bacterium]|nr:endonuclease V [Thermoguttaceae bacterium]MDW8079363.1 endonuclease V [Thermoguttaceae bacterium]